MAEQDRILWFSPDPRAVILPAAAQIPRDARKYLDRSDLIIRVDTAFEQVIVACSQRPEGTWINDDIIEAYCLLHELGFAHSVEVWQEDRLVGGLYGVALGGAFFGESMFHATSNASKAALAWLITRLTEEGFGLLDVQWTTPHLRRFGAIEIPRQRYLELLEDALSRPTQFLRKHEVPPDWIIWYRQPEEAVTERRLYQSARNSRSDRQ